MTLDPVDAPAPRAERPVRPPEPKPEDLATRPPWAPENAATRPLGPPALFGPEPFEDDEEFPTNRFETDEFPSATADDDGVQRLSGAGAFGGDRPSRFGAFDPGRRGVRALAAVAVLVVLVAAVLAWRSRPRVDPVAPPSIDPAAADASLSGDEPAAAGSAAPLGKPSAPVVLVVAVGGKVRKPGLVELPAGARVADALAAAGGAEAGVDVAPLNLARKVVDGELIMVGVAAAPGAGAVAPAVPGQPGAAGPVNLNLATLADLDTLPGVGPVLAQRILDAREAQGGFRAVSDLRKVQGIGSSRFEQLKDLVTV